MYFSLSLHCLKLTDIAHWLIEKKNLLKSQTQHIRLISLFDVERWIISWNWNLKNMHKNRRRNFLNNTLLTRNIRMAPGYKKVLFITFYCSNIKQLRFYDSSFHTILILIIYLQCWRSVYNLLIWHMSLCFVQILIKVNFSPQRFCIYKG